MNKTILAVILLVSAFSINAQSSRATSDLSHGYDTKKKMTQGHQFLLDDWVIGFLVDNNGKLSKRKLLNYDIYNNNPTSKTNTTTKDILVIDKNLYSGFVLKDSKNEQYIFSKIDAYDFESKKKETKYYQLVNAPKKTVIVESRKVMKDPNASGWSSSGLSTKAAKFVMKTSIYVLNSNNKYVKVKLSSSSISKSLKDKKKEIKAFIKQKDLKIKTASDLIPIMDYYHSL